MDQRVIFSKHRSRMPVPALEPRSGCPLPLEERPRDVRRRPLPSLWATPHLPCPALCSEDARLSPVCSPDSASSFVHRSCTCCSPACRLLLGSFHGFLLLTRPGHLHPLPYSPALFSPQLLPSSKIISSSSRSLWLVCHPCTGIRALGGQLCCLVLFTPVTQCI